MEMFTIQIQGGKSLQGHIQNVSGEYLLTMNCLVLEELFKC